MNSAWNFIWERPQQWKQSLKWTKAPQMNNATISTAFGMEDEGGACTDVAGTFLALEALVQFLKHTRTQAYGGLK